MISLRATVVSRPSASVTIHWRSSSGLSLKIIVSEPCSAFSGSTAVTRIWPSRRSMFCTTPSRPRSTFSCSRRLRGVEESGAVCLEQSRMS